MRFNDTSNTHDSLVHQCNFLVNTDNTSYPLADKARAANIWIGKIQGWIHEVTSGYEFDDPNYTNFPYTTFTLVDDQQDYELPKATDTGDATTLLSVLGVSVKNSAGLWSKLRLIEDWNVIGIDRYEYKKTPGMPTEFDLFGNSIWMFAPPDIASVTLAAGGRVYFTRSAELLTASSTTDQPPFASIHHAAVGYGMAYEYAIKNISNDQSKVKELHDYLYGDGLQNEGYKKMIQKHYANRNKTRRVRLTPSRGDRGQYR